MATPKNAPTRSLDYTESISRLTVLVTSVGMLLAGALLVKPRRATAQSAQQETTKRPAGVTAESRMVQRDGDTVENERSLYEELNRWHAPPALAGPLVSIQAVYQMADAVPIVTTDLGPGVRLGSVAPMTRQAALLQNLILGPNYAAISIGIP
jgi:hypothetical protein